MDQGPQAQRDYTAPRDTDKSFMTTTHAAGWGVWGTKPDKFMNPYCKEYTQASQNKTTARYYYTSIQVAKIQNCDKAKRWRGRRATGSSIPDGGIQTGTATAYCRLPSSETKPTLPKRPSSSALGNCPKAETLDPHKHLHRDVYRIFTQNSWNMEANQSVPQ